MRPASFEYLPVATLDEALAALAAGNGDARILAGGQSLVPAMTLRLARPGTLVDISRVPGLDSIDVGDDAITIGARVTHAAIERSRDLARLLPVLGEMAGHIAHPAIRNRGTFGGSLAHADPASEWPCALLGLGGSVEAVGPGGARTIEAGDFFEGLLTTALAPDEILVSATIPLHPGWRWSFHEVARQSGAFGLVLVLAGAHITEDGTIAEIRLAVGGCGARPVSPIADWTFLVGTTPNDALLDASADRAADALTPFDDVQLSAEDRRAIARTLVRRALAEACGVEPGGAR